MRRNCIASRARWMTTAGVRFSRWASPSQDSEQMIHLLGSQCHQRMPLR